MDFYKILVFYLPYKYCWDFYKFHKELYRKYNAFGEAVADMGDKR